MNAALSLTPFSVAVSLGTAIGLLWSTLNLPIRSKDGLKLFNLGTFSLMGSLVGGRGVYVSINWPYFQHHVFEIFQIWQGGISWAGALLGGILTTLILGRSLSILDQLRPLLFSITISAWIGSWLTGHAYGIKVDSLWGLPALDVWGSLDRRWPTQLAAILITLIIHWGVDQIGNRRWSIPSGLGFSLEIIGISASILMVSPFRADPAPLWNGIRLDSWAALGFLILSSATALVLLFTTKLTKTTHET